MQSKWRKAKSLNVSQTKKKNRRFQMAPLLRKSLYGFIALSALSATAPLHAETRAYEIEAQPLDAALKAFALQSNREIFFAPDLTRGKQTRGIRGQYDDLAALQAILAETGLTYAITTSNAILVKQSSSADPITGSVGGSLVPAAQGEATNAGKRLTAEAGEQGASLQMQDSNSERQSDKDGEMQIEEIIVTAQKRVERLQDVPISISVLDGAALDRSNQSVASELERVPGLAVVGGAFGSGKQLTVRGVSSTGGTFSGTSTVGFYLDSVPFGFVRQALSPDANAYDLERVEVLRGPQGTLYGVSAANGVVRVLTKDADLNEYQLKFRTSGSTTAHGGENYRGDIAANAPLIPGKLAVRAVAGYERLSGWVDRSDAQDVNDAKNLNARVKINAQLTDKLSAGLLAWHSKGETDARSLARDDMTTGITIPEPGEETYDIYGLKLGYEFSAFSFTSSSSYIDYRNETVVTFGGASTLPLFTEFNSEILSQEFNLLSTGEGPWQWALGGIYRDVEDLTHQNSIPGVFTNPNGLAYNDYSTSFAVFGELTRRLLDGQWEVTAGLRYFEDDAETQQRSNPFNLTAPLINFDSKFDAVSPRFVLTWHPNERLTTYASYAEGFRSGFSQSPTVLGNFSGFPSVDYDNLTNYELGVKGSTAGGGVGFEAAVFFMDWEGIQQSITVPAPGFPNGLAGLVNGKSASGSGAEISLTFRPAQGLRLGLNYAWNDLTFDEDVTSGVTTVQLLAPKGARMTNSPEHTGGVWAEYGFSLANAYEAQFSGSFNYVSERVSRAIIQNVGVPFNSADVRTARMSIGLTSPGGWSTVLFIENLFDEKGGTLISLGSTRPIEGDSRIRPRTVGLQFEYRL